MRRGPSKVEIVLVAGIAAKLVGATLVTVCLWRLGDVAPRAGASGVEVSALHSASTSPGSAAFDPRASAAASPSPKHGAAKGRIEAAPPAAPSLSGSSGRRATGQEPEPEPPSSALPSRKRWSEADSPWRRPGQCADEARGGQGPRGRYLASFERFDPMSSRSGDARGLYAARGVPTTVREQTTLLMQRVPPLAEEYLGLSSPPPDVYLHDSARALRANACVNEASVAYYDGSIHLGPSEAGSWRELAKSLEHEYVHHLLQSHDIQRPIWFQEGAAMAFAAEDWSSWRFAAPAIELEQMVARFPHTTSPRLAEAFYGQAYVMLTFLSDLCLAGSPQCRSVPELVLALQNGLATPETLFDWALERWAPGIPGSRTSLLEDYVTARSRLSPALQERARAHAHATNAGDGHRQ